MTTHWYKASGKGEHQPVVMCNAPGSPSGVPIVLLPNGSQLVCSSIEGARTVSDVLRNLVVQQLDYGSAEGSVRASSRGSHQDPACPASRGRHQCLARLNHRDPRIVPAMSYTITLIHKADKPVAIQLARVPVKGDFIEFNGERWEVRRVLLHAMSTIPAATVWAVPADFPLTLPG